MPANFTPVFSLTAVTPVGQLLSTAATAANAYDGTMTVGTSMALIYTAGVNGSRVDQVRIKYGSTAGGAPSGTTATTVVRIFINNGAANTTATNNTFFTDVVIPGVTYSNTTSLGEFTVPIGISIPASYRIYALNSTAIGGTNCALAVSAQGGDY
jgi:hypothetical protein